MRGIQDRRRSSNVSSAVDDAAIPKSQLSAAPSSHTSPV
jgi:hypothetical protein